MALTLTPREAVGALALLIVLAMAAAAWCAWQQGKDIGDLWDENTDLIAEVEELRADHEALQEKVAGIVDYLWDLAGYQQPELVPGDDTPTTVLIVQPDTDIAHPADTFARKVALLHKRPESEGRHRREGGGKSVPELLAEAGLEPS